MTTSTLALFARKRFAVRGFPPQCLNQNSHEYSLYQAALHQIRQSPEAFKIARSRWTLSLLRQHCDPLKSLRTNSGVWRRLRGWKIVSKRGQLHLHSPDPEYAHKVSAIAAVRQQARAQPEAVRLLYADEVSFYRQPFVGDGWQQKGKKAVQANLSHASNTRYRITGTLDAVTGQVVWQGASKMGIKALCQWLKAIRTFYGEKLRIVLVWDNWPVHKHPTVEAMAKEQQIELMYVPTYAPWCNPIEKLWRKMKQEILCLHPHSDNWSGLRERVATFLDQFAVPNPDVLKYVGLKT